MTKTIIHTDQSTLDANLFAKVSAIIDEGRKYVSTAVNLAEVYSKYQIGMYIVEEEQAGKDRAGYGKQILSNLSTKLTEKYGDGWSVEQLTLIRKFYMTYSKIVNTAYEIHNLPKMIDPSAMPRFTLSWSHYIVLMRIKNDDERRFYEIETLREHWSVRHLQRQYASSLYERLALIA